jgi:alcohol dehydrogenase class IV
VELPTTLKAIGIKKEDLLAVAKSATQTVEIPRNPLTIKYEDLLAIAEKVYE